MNNEHNTTHVFEIRWISVTTVLLWIIDVNPNQLLE